LQTEFKLPEPFEFNPAIQDADDWIHNIW
jgi:hypothetical protein